MLFAISSMHMTLLLAQAVPPDPALDLGGIITTLITAWNGRAYMLIVSVLVGTAVALMKQGYLSAWIAAHLPSKAIPFIAMLLGVLGTAAAQIQAGVPWLQAVINGILAGGFATAGHQLVIEGIRNGKELVPPTAKVKSQSMRPPPPPGIAGPGPVITVKNSTPPTSLRIARAFAITFCLSLVTLTTGCAANWWQQFTNNPVQQITSFVQTVEAFIQTAQTIWNLLLPLLGSTAATANATFNDALVALNNALGVAQDTVQAAVAAQAPTIDVAAIMKPVQDAVARVLAVIQQFQQPMPSGSVAAANDALTRESRLIRAWRW